MFLPISRDEAAARGWDELDVIFVTGDAYVDHPSFGVPLLARFLESKGFRVGIIPQPDWRSVEPFRALGRPRLFFAVAAGAMDSMVAHYTPARKLRHDDAYTPGNRHGARPNRAVIVYTARLKEAFPGVPVVIGGIEASLRRFAHYDFWDDKVRRSILLDAKADLLVYGMGERPLLELAERVREGSPLSALRKIRGTAYIAGRDEFPPDGTEIPSFEEVAADRRRYAEAFRSIAREQNPWCGETLVQRHGERRLVCVSPSLPLSEAELDALYALPFEKRPHPSYQETIPAFEQIRASITTHRGCYGGCAFCAITHHQGRFIQSRSESSVLDETARMADHSWFRGSISDLGGPTANMYGTSCSNREAMHNCRRESCLYPQPCRHLASSGGRGASLLRDVRRLPQVKNAAVSSGVRFDLLSRQPDYFAELLEHHVGGLLKVAPEHVADGVTAIMRKPSGKEFAKFLALFREETLRLGKKQYVVPYFISGHPGCTIADMAETALFLKRSGLKVEQVQDFTPTPGTLSTCIWYTGIDPYSGKEVYVPRGERERRLQKALLLFHLPAERGKVLEALRACGREDVMRELIGGPSVGPTVGRVRKHGGRR